MIAMTLEKKVLILLMYNADLKVNPVTTILNHVALLTSVKMGYVSVLTVAGAASDATS